jgi:hypothetical protein
VDDSRQGRLDSRLGGGRRRQSSFKGKGSRKTLEAWPLAALRPGTEGGGRPKRDPASPPGPCVLDSVAASRPSSSSDKAAMASTSGFVPVRRVLSVSGLA